MSSQHYLFFKGYLVLLLEEPLKAQKIPFNTYWILKKREFKGPFFLLINTFVRLAYAFLLFFQILERTLEPDSSDEEPPPVYSPPSYEMHIYDRKHPADVPPFPPPRQEHGKEEWELWGWFFGM